MTFEEADGYNVACKLTKKGNWLDEGKYITISEEPIYLKPAPEPSNINWLRQSMDKSARRKR